MPESYAIKDVIAAEYPDINLLLVSNSNELVKECLEKVSVGEADAYVGNLTVGSYIIRENGYLNIKVAAPTGFDDHENSIAIRDDWPELVSIINKTLNSFNDEDHTAIINKWMSIRYEYGIRWWYFAIIILIACTIFLSVLLVIANRNKKLNKEIVERKQAEEQNRIVLYNSTQSANLGIWIYYPDEDTIKINTIWCKQLNYEPNELRENDDEWSKLIGGSSKWVDLMHPEDRDHASNTLNNYLSGTSDEFRVEFRLRTKDGLYRWILSVGRKLKWDSSGRVTQMNGVHMLIDEIKEIQEKLEISKESAEKALTVKGNFLANMSHEIRTPINAIIGLNELMQNTGLNSKQNYYAEKIDSSSKNLLSIVNEILDFSKLESGKIEIEQIEFSIDDLFDNLASIVSYKAFKKGIELLIYKDPKIPVFVKGDSFRLLQVLLNLTSNAIKFTENGEVYISAELVSNQKTIKIKFSVKDTGIGMTREQSTHLFNAFEQADNSTTRKYGGTGLGLAISKNLINLMGSEILVESNVDEGSEFTFTLSFDKPIENIDNVPIISEEAQNKKVLIFEDNLTAKEIFEEYLECLKNKPIIIPSGANAIDLLNSNFYDVIIMNCNMLALNGIDIYFDNLRNKSGSNNTKVVLIDAYCFDSIKTNLDANDFDLIISKPLSQRVLYNAISGINPNLWDNKDCKNPSENNLNMIKGAKILLAEDDEINQIVAKEMLRNAGFIVDIANNGAIAIDMLKQNYYDLVLMDLQMPVMDGYDASEFIRDKISSSLPIIALSADVLSGIEKKTQTAGMNDYISKPIDKNILFEKLLIWLDKESISNNNNQIPKEEINNDYLFKNLPNINVSQGLERINYNTALYVKLLNTYVKNYEEFFKEFKNHISNSEIEEAQKKAHMLKGVTGNLGMESIHKIMCDINNALKEKQFDSIDILVNKAETVHLKMISYIKTII